MIEGAATWLIRHPLPTAWSLFGVGFGLVAPSSLAGQIPKSSQETAEAWTVARTADGHPDLQGVWSFETATPFERPEKLKDKAFFTEVDVAEWEKGRLRTAVRGVPVKRSRPVAS
jgi:hypothetical protein